MTIVSPIDQKSVAAIEKLIGQTIPWADSPPPTGGADEERPARHRSGSHRTRSSHARAERPRGKHPAHGRERPERERPPANVASLETARPQPRPEPQRERAREPGDHSHLPAFLLRPTRVKA